MESSGNTLRLQSQHRFCDAKIATLKYFPSMNDLLSNTTCFKTEMHICSEWGVVGLLSLLKYFSASFTSIVVLADERIVANR